MKLIGWLTSALTALFGGVNWPVPCPECSEPKRSLRRLAAHMAADHPEVVA